jgi:hypothetical protein
MATLATFWSRILLAIQGIGYFYFILIVIADIILWKIHPVLGIIGVIFTFALLFGLI